MAESGAGNLLVTGGSRGIGAATAEAAAARGYCVMLTYRERSDDAGQVVSRIAAAGGRAVAHRVDVADEAQIRTLFEVFDRRFGRLDALVNNAGLLERQGRLENMDGARLQRVFAANVFGTMLCAREAVRRMSTRHGGSGGAIVNLSSVAARLGSPGEYVDYAASKGAIDTFTVGLAHEVAGEGIRVNAVRPGIIHTEIHASAGEPGRVERLRGSVPMGRGGTAEEVAAAILWLLSGEAGYVTGVCLDVSGGR